ncbi:anti-sigma-I factor RsgI family protein [Clostridium sp. HV4-5-A1G]|uniref:anti-sigma-I factor RsgI family protein n=1 Tax=Clostridium sp. HV4-5-A1G TaxID=2004595 RepID=UPI00123AF844|nr:anti-sigma factor domain-containing protein [Clostridium sp. HV4-5-A1G]KAA8674647.1 anti-sigma factor domain-containing protein [Clostridium sp. HV4-5-A1G]CAB1246104.1 Anti-sigma-I factor RsgI [Clostridiaceae bacterium BL-3]
MNKREGIVISIDGKCANLLTPYGEFIKVDCNGKKPNIGEEFMGNQIVHRFYPFSARKILAAACIMFVLIIGGGAKAYYSPSATVLVNINPDIELKVNFLNRIISFKALDDDGSKILSQVKIDNVNINDGLKIIIDQSKKDKFIDEEYIKTKTISIDINGKNVNISKFKLNMETSDLKVKIQSNGSIILNKNSNGGSNKSTNGNSNKDPNKNVKSTDNMINNRYLNSESNYKKPNNNSFQWKNSTNSSHNSISNRYNSKRKSYSKQLQHPGVNKIKTNRSSIKNINNRKVKESGHKNGSNKSGSSKRNSSIR